VQDVDCIGHLQFSISGDALRISYNGSELLPRHFLDDDATTKKWNTVGLLYPHRTTQPTELVSFLKDVVETTEQKKT